MIDYIQPDFYRFNQDSLELIRFIQQKNLKVGSILDIGAGSGVIGIELSKNLLPKHLTLLELQTEFGPFLTKNIELFVPSEVKASVILSSMGDWKTDEKFDLIICNPPYYLPGHGQGSQDHRRQLCRSFQKDGWEVLLKKIIEWLSPKGRAFLVIKNDQKVLKKISEFENLHYRIELHHQHELVFAEIALQELVKLSELMTRKI